MSKINLTPNASGTGVFTIASPNSNTDRTLNLPDEAGTILSSTSDIESQVKTATNASGSAPIYSCRAWVNFNGTGTVAIRASGNVSSITDIATGEYTVNFTTAIEDADYGVSLSTTKNTSSVRRGNFLNIDSDENGTGTLPATSSLRIRSFEASSAASDAGVVDTAYAYVAIFR